MLSYLDDLKYIKNCGVNKSDRTGTGTISTFGILQRYSLANGQLPVVTSKRVHLKSVIHELIWMISGDTNIRYLKANGVRIWDEWVKPGTEEYAPLTHEEMIAVLDKVPEYRFRELQVLGIDTNYSSMPQALTVWKELFNTVPQKLIAGDLGPVYGQQWRAVVDTKRAVIGKEHFDTTKYEQLGTYVNLKTGESEGVWERTIDQLSNIIEILKTDPDSRRMVIDSWQVPDLDEMALTPCHHTFQFYTTPMSREERIEWVSKKNLDEDEMEILNNNTNDKIQLGRIFWNHQVPEYKLSCMFVMRSNDMFLGNPFNIAFYGAMTHAMCNMLNMEPGELVYAGGDCHIYSNHIEQVNEQITRKTHPLPTISFKTKGKDIRELEFDDFIIEDYQHEAPIAAKVAI